MGKTATPIRWTRADLELFPDDGTLYEIIEGELFMSKQPHWHHQRACTNIAFFLEEWARTQGGGSVTQAPGLTFDDASDVAPDVVWVSEERLRAILGEDGHLHGAPELIVEVLSPGLTNERRDRQAKLKLYSLRGVQEYWIADWRTRTVEVYRRQEGVLCLIGTWREEDELSSPLLPGFQVRISELFA